MELKIQELLPFALKYANASSSRSECIEMLRNSCAAERISTMLSVRIHAVPVSRNLFKPQKTHQTLADLTTRKNQWKRDSANETYANCTPRACIFGLPAFKFSMNSIEVAENFCFFAYSGLSSEWVSSIRRSSKTPLSHVSSTGKTDR